MKPLKISILLLTFCQITFGQIEGFNIKKYFVETGECKYEEGGQRFELDSILDGDTLKLIAQIPGEHGRHNESILVFKNEEELFVDFLFDGNFSEWYHFELPSRLNFEKKTKQLCSAELKDSIYNYLHLLKKFSREIEEYWMGTGIYGIEFKNSKIYFIDNGNWEPKYKRLRDLVFKNNLKVGDYNKWYFYGLSQIQSIKIIEYLDKEIKKIESLYSPNNFSSGETFYEEEIRRMPK